MSSTHKTTHTPLARRSEAGTAFAFADSPQRSTRLSRTAQACVFWMLCLVLTAAGHRLYQATVQLDRRVSARAYKSNGRPLVWIGHGSLEDARERTMEGDFTTPRKRIRVLPNSSFWLAASIAFTVFGGLLAWSGRWILHSGFQSLIGLFAGHLLWLGAIELGLDAAARRLGLAGTLETITGKLVGTHGAGILIQLSIVFLVPILLGFSMHESNRCALFQWIRKRIPIAGNAAPSGRVRNYSARTAIQYFFTVWFCYVCVLWLADPRCGRAGELLLLVTMLGIFLATPYMIWRTAQQSGQAQALRYSVSGSVVTWTAIEIAAAQDIFGEPWLSNSLLSAAILLGVTLALTGWVISMWLPRREGSIALPTRMAAVMAILVGGAAGCTKTELPASLAADRIAAQLSDYDRQISRPHTPSQVALLRALHSSDPRMRAQAAIALSKLRRVGRTVQQQLEALALSDESRLSQVAAFMALRRLRLMSPRLWQRLRDLESDPDWSLIARGIQK